MTSTVLIVDDDRTLTDMLNYMLNRQGFATRVAPNGAKALEILQAERIDTVVLDVMLPDVDGFEVCRRIRALPKLTELPILILSGRGQVSDRITGFEAGADDYVTKPVVIKELIVRIRTLITRSNRAKVGKPFVVAFVGARGGAGTTTVALNVALSLISAHLRVVLMELGGVGLSIPWFLSLKPTQTLLSLTAPAGFRLSMAALESCLITHPSGLAYLPGHGHELTPLNYHPGVLGATIDLLQSTYNVVIIDLSNSALMACREVLAHTSTILPVVPYESTCAYYLQPLLAWFQENKLEDKVPGIVLVDRSPGAKKEPAPDLVSSSGLGIMAVVPSAVETLYYASSCQQALYLAAPGNPASTVLAELGKRLTSILTAES